MVSVSAAPELAPREFDLAGPLPTGVTVLEASAGTGKTYTIAGLAARYVADGVPLHELLLVTFTRIATGELRERVRDRLVEVEAALCRAQSGDPVGADPVARLLAAWDIPLRRARLASAIADFDAATIATTHGFCQEMLGGLGIAGELDPDVAFVQDLSDLVADVVDDLYVRRFSPPGREAAFGRQEAGQIARAAISDPWAEIVTGSGEVAQMRGRLALAARQELHRRKRALAVMTYDDLVSRLRAALTGANGEATTAALRARYRVVLVDEFQDTDPAQWAILRRAFGEGETAMVLIADPKQAIYAFRGADVYAYLEAARTAGDRATLQLNRRCDQGLIDAHDALLAGVKLGHEGIAYREVRAPESHRESRLRGAPVGAPMRIRVAGRDEPAISLTQNGFVQVDSGREFVALDLAADVVALLDSPATIDGDPIAPEHVAVLVRTNRQAAIVRQALGNAGVPAVINGAGSVFTTEIAAEWLRLLEALERPSSTTRAHAAALTSFVGWTAEQVAAAGDDEDSPAWEAVHRELHDFSRVLRTRGVASLLQTITVACDLARRVLADADGERRLTDLRHVGQLLHVAATEEQLGPTALTGWLRARIAEAESDTADEERSRRLEFDARAVQVLTIHRSKGLEFPIVYLPYLWDMGWISDDREPVFFHDPERGDRRTLDVALEGRDYRDHRERFIAEQRGEDLRLAYVALTRARHQVVLWWAGSYGSRNSPLGRLLFARAENGDIAPAGTTTPDDARLLARLRGLVERAPGSIAVQPARLALPAHFSAAAAASSELVASAFTRDLDLRWRRTSFTDITAAAHDAWVASEPEEPLVADEPPADLPGAPSGATGLAPQLALPSPLGELPVGAEVGTFVHRVLEATDFAAADLDAELAARVDEVRRRRPIEIGDPALVAAGLRTAIETPLGPVLGGARLRDVARADRLDELGFELPLAGGDRPRDWLTLERVADVLRERLDRRDPLAAYARRLADPSLRHSVRGYLTGSLDLVVRRRDDDADRFAVLDYKTNWLGEADEPLTAYHYRPHAIAAEMSRHHYLLQALLYLVALHRFLRWRVPGYRSDRHLAGVVYLFVRGMTGPDGGLGDPSGVFGWCPPPGFVDALSDALDHGGGQ
ncbi:MAG: UvrD-helicase domain-containing protein [Solirubrobacterales bacterium]|nr:UvrD-helicase domain-containing protein [Solirubrobacterales bacterium]